jgi:hypothetical protein
MTTQNDVRPGRNEPCRCGSGRKYKHCCLAKDDTKAAAVRAEAAAGSVDQLLDETPSAVAATPKPKTDQPWKTQPGSSTRGFVPRSRTPRKVGGG